MPVVKIFVGLPAVDNYAREFGVDRNIMRRAGVLRAIQNGGDELLTYERRRLRALKSPPLSENTLEIKKRKKKTGKPYRISAAPHWILRENDELLDSIEAEKTHGGKRGYNVGILNDKNHENFNYGSGTVGELAKLHMPRWPFVAQPPRAVMERIQTAIVEAIQKELEKEDKKNARPVPNPRRQPPNTRVQ